MSNIPKMKGRFQQKIGTTEDWQKAHEAGFVPLEGEIIVYQDYEDGNPVPPRHKVGDGNTLVGDLPFSAGGVLEEGLNPTSTQQGNTGSLAGVKGLYWTELTAVWLTDEDRRSYCFNLAQAPYGSANAAIDLDTIANYFSPGDILTIHAGSKFDKALTVLEVTATDWQDRPCQLICEGHSSLLDKLQNEYKAGMDFSDNAIFCPAKPEAGVVDFGKYAFAIGEMSKAINYAAVSMGRKNEAYGQYATAFGRENSVGYAGFAAGRNNTVSGESAAAFNQGNTASGNWSFAGGYKSHATNSASIAYGHVAKATGLYSTAFGEQAEAKGAGTIAAGRYVKAEGDASQALGLNTIAKSAYQFVCGKYNIEDDTETYAHIIGGGHADNNRVNIHTVDWNGNAWYKGSINANKMLVQGFTVALEKDLVGRRLDNGGELFNSAAEAGTNAHAEGLNTKATGSYGHAEGYNTKVTATAGHAEGHTTEAGYVCHAEGQNTVATGSHAHAEGLYTLASGNRAHAEGEKTEASGARSHAGGVGTKATALAQTAIGKFNAVDNDALFIVGNGSGSIDANGNVVDYAPSNAFVVKEDGTGYLGGKKIQTVTPGFVLTDITSRTEDLQKGGAYLVLTRSQTSDEYYDSFVLYCSGGGYFYTTTDGTVIQANQVAYNMSVQPFIFTPGENVAIEVLRIA